MNNLTVSTHTTPESMYTHTAGMAAQQPSPALTTSHQHFRVVPADGSPIGAEILDLDLSQADLNDAGLILGLRRALHDYQVLVFRGQESLTPEQHVDFSRRWGDLYPHLLTQYMLEERPEVLVVSNETVGGKRVGLDGQDGTTTGTRYFWHSDLSYMERPPMASCLLVRKCPGPEAQGNKTLFADMYGAYETLPPALRQRVRGLKATHIYTKYHQVDAKGLPAGLTEEQAAQNTEVVHPVVRTHPETGRECLFVSSGFTRAIVGLSKEQSNQLLQALHKHAEGNPSLTFTHHWTPGDMVLWDNRCVLHYATGSDQPRTLHRTTIQATHPHDVPRLIEKPGVPGE